MIYTSPIDVWNVQEQEQDSYRREYEKTKCIDLVLKRGDTIFIPSYWWWSIAFNMISLIESASYYTPMNLLANGDKYAMCILQNANVKHILS